MDFISNIIKTYFLYDKNIIPPVAMSSESEICPVCQDNLNDIKDDFDKKKYTTKCGHTFHHKCVKPWFENNDSCPTCREILITSNIRHCSFESSSIC